MVVFWWKKLKAFGPVRVVACRSLPIMQHFYGTTAHKVRYRTQARGRGSVPYRSTVQ